MKTIIVWGSARSDGNTAAVVNEFAYRFGGTILNLQEFTVAPYSYDGSYPAEDAFIKIMERVVAHDRLILASPVYWYTMSAQLKVFVDRFSDLLTIHKALGRDLCGTRLGVLSCAGGQRVNDSYYEAFYLTALYLGMPYAGEWHGWVKEGEVNLVQRPK